MESGIMIFVRIRESFCKLYGFIYKQKRIYLAIHDDKIIFTRDDNENQQLLICVENLKSHDGYGDEVYEICEGFYQNEKINSVLDRYKKNIQNHSEKDKNDRLKKKKYERIHCGQSSYYYREIH